MRSADKHKAAGQGQQTRGSAANWQITLAFTIDTDEQTADALSDRLIEAGEALGLNFEGGCVDAWPVRKARIGWWVDDRWCPTKAIRDHELRMRFGDSAR